MKQRVERFWPKRKKRFSQGMAALLAGVLTIGVLPMNALAYLADVPEHLSFIDGEGKTVSTSEDWEKTFPYGTFAFSNFQAVAEEGAETTVIQVYRLGGTEGRAVAYISYTPALVQLENGETSYSTAAGSDDIVIEVEDPLPGAEDQPIGQAPAPRQPEQAVKVTHTVEEDGTHLSIDVEADAYQWYVSYAGDWKAIDGAVNQEMVVSDEYLQRDFRCVYTLGDVQYCSDSYWGKAYVAESSVEEETEKPVSSEPVALNPEPTFTRIAPETAEDPYSGYVFDLTFADGEWVKEIRVTVPEDTQAEALKFGTFTIVDHQGASLYDTANTLALQVVDNDTPEESRLGFAVTEVRADKAAGKAEVTVRRTGGNQSMITVDYATEDGSAKAGQDYAAASGTLTFYGDMNEQVIEIPLINDGVVTDEERSFRVVLSNLKGDGEAACTLDNTAAEVALYNSGESGAEENLVTHLYQSEVSDVSGSVAQTGNSVVSVGTDTVSAVQTENEEDVLTASIEGTAEDGVSPLSYNYPGRLSFSNGGWSYAEPIPSSGWSGGSSYDGGIWTYRSSGAGSAALTFDPRMYKGISASFGWECAIASAWTMTWYGMEYTYPWAKLLTQNGAEFAKVDSGVTDNGSYWEPEINWYTSSYLSKSWSIADGVNRLQLGTSRHDSHDSNGDAQANLKSGSLYRRTFGGDFYLQIHTANDSGEGYGNSKTAPEGAASLTESSGVYGSMRPVVTIQSGQGGVYGGDLFVGTTLQVELKNTASYEPAKPDSNLTYAVYLTNQDGKVVASSSSSGTTHYLKLLWDGMTDADVTDSDYTINVVMTRKQDLKLDLTPSVPRMTDENGNVTADIDTSKIGQAASDFWNSTSVITYGYSEEKYTNGSISYIYHENGKLTKENFTQSGAVLSKLDLENIQWVNFNLPAEDKIVYNGRTYGGNEKIYLSVADLASSSMTFYYYDAQYLSATSVMAADISEVELFLDGNANGKIDGYYDANTGYFIVDEASGDQSFGFLDPDTDYNETLFTPVPVTVDGETKYGQYFMKVYYTMNPRSLVPPDGTDTNRAWAQVLPAFVSSVTDPDSYELLTQEQQSYRYLISGKTKLDKDGDEVRSSDYHTMYGSAATTRSMVDVPLGGDTSPAELNADGTAYTWMPDYQGNLLYPFENPEPIFIADSVAGSNIPVAEVKGYENGQVVLEEGGVDQLNGYLGSLTANNTVALCVQEQKATTEEIARANGVTIGSGDIALQSAAAADTDLDVESTTLADTKTTPDARYLQENGSAGEADGNVDMAEADSDYSEFNQDFFVQLPSTDIGVTDFASIVMDGDQVGFSLGLPLGGYSSSDGAVSPAKALGDSKEGMEKLLAWMKKPNMENAKAADDSLKNVMDQKDSSNSSVKSGKAVTSKGFSAEFALGIAFLWKFDSVSNEYKFSQFSVAASAELAFTYQARFTPVPLIYMYVSVGIGIELGTGATVERETVEGASLLSAPVNLTKGQYKILDDTTYKSSNLTFNGKLLVEAYTDADCTQSLAGFQKGYLESNGKDPVLVVLDKRDKAQMDQPVYLKLTALEDTQLDSAVEVVKTQNLSYWSGFSISPELFVEAGVGVGIEIMKIEVYVKINVGCAMTLGAYDTDAGKYEGFSFDEFEFGMGLGFRVVLLFFSYEMDLISYSITYEKDRNPEWQHSWSALGGLYGDDMELSTITATDADGNTYDVHIRLPGSAAETQELYTADTSAVETMAFDPTDKEVPFQLSGYGSSGDAFKLADGLISGYDYQVVTVGENNYLLYTVSRTDAAHPVDNSMLVLSRIQLTSTGGSEEYGLVNPVDAGSETPYIVVDKDKAGDLEFTGWADGDTLRIAWVSYAKVTENSTAAGEKPEGAAPVGMTESNYEQVFDDFKKTEPTPVKDPGTEPVAPVEADYYVTAEVYNTLSQEEQAKYTQDTDTEYYYSTSYGSYKAASEAYTDAQSEYTADKAAYAQAKAAYEKYQEEKAAYDSDYKIYNDWYIYFKSVDDVNAANQEIANQAAQNTVVKTASFNTTTPSEITDAKTVSGAAGSHVYLPGGSSDGSVTIYAKAKHYTDTKAMEAEYAAYLNKIYTTDDASKNIKAYREAYQKGLWDAYGSGTELHAVVGNQDTAVSLPEGQILDNMEITEINGVYYVAYTTSEQSYVQENNYSGVSGANATDQLTTKRLYLQTLTVTDGQPAWGNALLLRTLVDYDQNTKTDGAYVGGKLTDYQDPYFSNLQFLNGKLGGLEGEGESFDVATLSETSPEEFLLFEMNGSTFVIPQADLVSIAASHSGSIIPFFQPEAQTGADGEDATPSSTGRAEVTIGADGAGNISAVYVSTVEGTTNNALFLTKWDPQSQTWGAGTMLAMNYMQVYEDAAANGWSASDTEQAYLGKLEGYAGGGMDQLTFSNLQIALGQTAQEENTAQTMSAEKSASAQVDLSQILAGLGGSEIQTMSANDTPNLTDAQNALLAEAGAGETKDTLLVLTQGTTQYLQEGTYTDVNGDEQTVVVPIEDAYAQALYDEGKYDKKPGLGVYAISYGVGQRSVGNANVDFSGYDFTAGSELYVKASFQNTGDVALRGSEANPITARLMLRIEEGAEATALAQWEIPQNITAGQTVSLSGTCAALTEDLPEGSIFYLDVAEDDTYIADGAFRGTTLSQDPDTGAWTGGFVVENKPELGFEHFDITTAQVDENGNTVLNVDFQVGNRGNETAEDVYVQFSYESGRDEQNNPVYTVLDITENDLTVSKQQKLDPLSLILGGGTDEQNGILRLKNTDGSDMDPNMGRTVTGTLTVPPEVYQGTVNGSLNLRVEIFAGDDAVESRSADGLITASHSEYNTDNNSQVAQIEHTTFFETAAKVTLAMGNTMRLPVSIATSTGKAPVIQVEEVQDTEGAAKNLGVLYYEQSASPSTGNTEGVLVIAPSREGSGIIHIKDEATNTIQSVTYEVTEAGEGINIFKNNGMFTFYNKNGTPYDESAQAATQDWSFNGNISTWGSDGSAPYLSNLSNGKVGAYFTFDTVATSIDFHFNGKIKVESTYPGFTAKELTCAGGEQSASVSFGSSEQSHTVKVTVLDNGDSNATADFDVLVEHFASGQPPVPALDANHPHIYWSRSFPDTASLKAGESQVELTVYALDDTGIASLTVNGVEPEHLTKHSSGYWSAQLTIEENGKLDVAAVDNSGNRTTQAVTVDWFNTTVTSGAISTAPDLTAQFEKNGTELEETDYVTGSDTVVAAAQSETEGVTYSAQRITVHTTDEDASELVITKLDPLTDAANTFDAKANGYYVVTVTATDGTWSQTVLEMAQVDTELPVASLSLSEDGTALSWNVSKSDPELSPIAGAAINGFDLNVGQRRTAVAGTFPIQYGGTYTLTGKDAANHTAEQSLAVPGLPIQAEDESVCTVTDAWNQARNNGVITIDPTALTGGVYDAEKSIPAENQYHGRYEVLLMPTTDIFDAEAVRQELLDAYAEQYFEEHPDAEADDPAAVMPEEELNAALAERETKAWSQWLETALATDQDANWTELTEKGISFPGLTPGAYTVLFRDANEKQNAEVIAQRSLTVGDEAIVMETESSVEHNGGRDGSITVTAQNGRLESGTYQFLIRPVENGESALLPVDELTQPLDQKLFPAEDGWTTPAWETSDLASGTLSTGVFTGLRSGWYQVAVRTMEDVSAMEMQDLITAYQALLAAEERVETAENALTESALTSAAAEKQQTIREALQAWQSAKDAAERTETWNNYLALIGSNETIQNLLQAWADADYADGAAKDAYDAAVAALTLEQAQQAAQREQTDAEEALPVAEQAYTDKKAALEAKAAGAYENDPTLWDNAATMLVQIGSQSSSSGSTQVEIYNLYYDKEHGMIRVPFSSNKTGLSEAAERQLIRDNADLDILAYSNSMEVWIPAGTLAEGDDLMEMLMPTARLPKDSGYLVQYTAADGTVHPVTWSYVTPGKVYYVAAAPGKYEIVAEHAAFSDVPSDFWGVDAIAFTAARGLFAGNDKGEFQPEAPMTRGMFVTVLCRLIGAELDYDGTSEFTDVSPDAWYAPYVAWATEHGIVTGYGNGQFGPEDPVSREQMCVLMQRLLDALDVELPEGGVDGFADAGSISDWAVDAVGSFSQWGLIRGVGEDTFAPANGASRAEVAALYRNLIQRLLAD